MKFVWTWLLGFIVSLTWLLLFPYKAGGEFAWQLQSVPLGMTSKRTASFYYLMSNKTILCLAETFSLDVSGVAAAQGSWRVLRKDPQLNLWQIWRSQELIAEYQGEGYPFIKGERLFHISSDNTVLAEYSLAEGQEGKLLGKMYLPSSLLSFSACKEKLALGLSGGELLILEDLGDFKDGQSIIFEDSLVTGVALSEYQASQYLAFTEGVKRTYWHLYKEVAKNQWKEVTHGELGRPLGYETRIIFDQKFPLVFIEAQEILLIHDLVKEKSVFVKNEGYLIDAFHSLGLDYYLSYLPDKKTVTYKRVNANEEVVTLGNYVASEPQWGLSSKAIYWIDMDLEEKVWCLLKGQT